MIRINKKLLAVLLVAAMLFGAAAVIMLAGNGLGGTALLSSLDYGEYKDFMSRFDKLNTLLDYIEENYYTDIDIAKLLDGAYSGLVAGIGDKYSEYVSAEELDAFYQQMAGKFYGIGVLFTETETNLMRVLEVYEGSPAETAGMLAGDVMTAVDGQSIQGIGMDAVRDLVRGEKDSPVEITVLRGDQELTLSMLRSEFNERTVESEIIDVEEGVNIGYISISSFSQATAGDFRKALTEIEAEDVKGLVIDLRCNGGGLVDVACEVADMLMNKGTIAYAMSKDGAKEIYTTQDGRTPLNYVVLVDEYTASASEILSIGVKDNKEGRLVGVQTFGKGIIQITQTMPDGSAVKLTYMEYYSPSGEKIHGVGITPDYEVELPLIPEEGSMYIRDTQLEKAVELLTEAE